MKTVGNLIHFFKHELAHSHKENELKQIINIVFEHYLGYNTTQLLLSKSEIVDKENVQKLLKVVEQLKKEKPLAYIIGKWEFYGLPLKINEHTLIPRPETEELVALILSENKGNQVIFDIGTGSGCIPIALKKNQPAYLVWACDISENALKVATHNAQQLINDFNFFNYDILKNRNSCFETKFDVIVSNPPYITKIEKKQMSKSVLDYEPDLALFVENENPLLFYDAIADFAKLNLLTNGKLYFEVNPKYAKEIVALLHHKSFNKIRLIKDINKKNRFVCASIN